MFLYKLPCRYARVLDSADCPPHEQPHDISDYKIFYDPLYYPQYHSAIFANCDSTTEWLQNALIAHLQNCHNLCRHAHSSSLVTCHVEYCDTLGFVFSLQFASFGQRHFYILPLAEFESQSFSFCRLLSGKQNTCSDEISFADAEMLACMSPAWLHYPSAIFESRLAYMSKSSLIACAALGSAPIKPVPRTKEAVIKHILQSFTDLKDELLALSTHKLRTQFCSRRRHYLPQFHEQCFLLAASVAAHALLKKGLLSCFVEPPYLIAPTSRRDTYQTHLPWLDLPLTDLTDRLRKLRHKDLLVHIREIAEFRQVPYDRQSMQRTMIMFLDHLRRRATILASMSMQDLCLYLLQVDPLCIDSQCELTRGQLIEHVLEHEYGNVLIDTIRTPIKIPTPIEQRSHESKVRNSRRQKKRRENKLRNVKEVLAHQTVERAAWPSRVPMDCILQCVRNYREATIWQELPVCSVCSERVACTEVVITDRASCFAASQPHARLHLELLEIVHQSIEVQAHISDAAASDFDFGALAINGLMLEMWGVVSCAVDGTAATVRMCNDCIKALSSGMLPRLALANKLYRGRLPNGLADLTWVEEMVCAMYRNTAYVTRLYGSSEPDQPRVLFGNTCAHEMNVISTASVLPRTPADVRGMLSIVFIGTARPGPNAMKKIFRVRKEKICSFLLWLQKNNRLYCDIPIDDESLNQYPDDGCLPGIENVLIHDTETSPEHLFNDETSGFACHPASLLKPSPHNTAETPNNTSNPDYTVLIERTGVTDPESDRVPGRAFTATALKNLAGRVGDKSSRSVINAKPSDLPDLIIRRGSQVVQEYNNPLLMPGMFPTLFPLGTGGLEDPDRVVKVSFQLQIQHYLRLPQKEFRRHFAFIFVALNIIQRRIAHLHTYFTCSRANFDTIASKLVSISSTSLLELSERLEQEGSLKDLPEEQRHALELLKHVDTISARVPGSQASKIYIRNEIRNYFGYFGLPHIFLTFNPNPTHSPIFQVMCGNRTIDLASRFPIVLPKKDRAIALAEDPVAAADFYEFVVKCLFQHLLGWNYKIRMSTDEGGLLGKV